MPVLKRGSSGTQVSNLQQRLNELGFDPNGFDGKFGPGTEAAVIAFQKANGLEADGKVGPNTLAALNLNPAGGNVPDSTSNGGGTNGSGPLTLTEDDYKEAAELLNCEVAAIKAVAEVESGGEGFLPDGRPKILFERHQFRKFTNGEFDATHPGISNKKARGYGPAGAHQWDRFNEAAALNRTAAIKAASWGKFQVMGFNFAHSGFDTLEDFHAAMLKNEAEHLKACCRFITINKLDRALRNHDWVTFARGYNGEGFRENKYDEKLAAAFRKHSNN